MRNSHKLRDFAYIEMIFSLMLLVCQIHDQIFVGELYRIAKFPSVLNDFVVWSETIVEKIVQAKFQ